MNERTAKCVTRLRRFVVAAAAFTVTLPVVAAANAPAGHFVYTSASVTVLDAKTNLTWQRSAAAGTFSWQDAATYCASSPVSAALGGSGWRLPTLKELQTLVDYSQPTTLIDPNAFPSTGVTPFWASTVKAGMPTFAWLVQFGAAMAGRTGYVVFSNTLAVRCVR